MNQLVIPSAVVIGSFAAILSLMEVGRRIGVRRRDQHADGAHTGLGAIDGAIFGLMGLLIAFTFQGASARFDTRRQLVGEESNAIGTAYMRIDLLPSTSQPELREDFRNYLDARISYYRDLSSDAVAAKAEMDKSVRIQDKIWSESVAACGQVGLASTTSLVLSSLNQMIDITTTQTVAHEMHPPPVVYRGLAVLVLASAWLAGYGMAEARTRNWLHMIVFSLILAIAVYVIFDLESPRTGLIRIDAADHVLVDLRNRMR